MPTRMFISFLLWRRAYVLVYTENICFLNSTLKLTEAQVFRILQHSLITIFVTDCFGYVFSYLTKNLLGIDNPL
jgi:hypothetical protein